VTSLNTARGAIDTAHLGVTLMHEHVFILTSEILQNYPEGWGDESERIDDAIARLNELKSRGVDTIVDLTVIGLGSLHSADRPNRDRDRPEHRRRDRPVRLQRRATRIARLCMAPRSSRRGGTAVWTRPSLANVMRTASLNAWPRKAMTKAAYSTVPTAWATTTSSSRSSNKASSSNSSKHCRPHSPARESTYSTKQNGEHGNPKTSRHYPTVCCETLDANLELLGAGRRHYLMIEAQVQAMFRTIYLLLRDTGRRPMEICGLRTDCIGGTADEPVLRWYSYKMGRPGRDLPIEQATAQDIGDWIEVREALSIPKGSRDYLFPAVTEVAAEPYLRPPYFAYALRMWARNIPFIGSGIVDNDGNEIAFDRSNIYPYSFRHSWAQRHADSGTQIEVLAELLDHEGLDSVGAYYGVSDKRKRSAIAKVAQHTFNHRGKPRPPVDASTYQLRSLAVPYGNCTEPANVKSGGQTCPIRFQCSGCGFYRPDPSHLAAIEQEVHALRKNHERALAIDVEPYVLESIQGQIASYSRIVAEMKKTIAAMPEDERNNLLEAATIMRRIRAGQQPQLKIEPVTKPRTHRDDGS
jgi:site-specific recombinase XerD